MLGAKDQLRPTSNTLSLAKFGSPAWERTPTVWWLVDAVSLPPTVSPWGCHRRLSGNVLRRLETGSTLFEETV